MTWMHFKGPGFTMQVPSNWLITSSSKYQLVFVALAHKWKRAALNISLHGVKENITVQSVAEAVKEKQQTQLPDYEILEETSLSKSKVGGFLRLYRWSGKNGGKAVQWQAFFKASKILYTLTATRIETEDVELGQTIFEMIQSFGIVEAAPSST